MNTRGLRTILGVTLILIASLLNISHADNTKRPDGHAPISIMGDHTHNAGEWMLSYRLMTMQMSENYVNSNTVTNQEVWNNFMVAPQSMDMDMHMLGAMYAPTDDVTLMLMANYLSSSMDHISRMGMEFTTETSGISDTKIGALLNINKDADSFSHMNLALSIPTGSKKKKVKHQWDIIVYLTECS